jgi:hypothetical protein
MAPSNDDWRNNTPAAFNSLVRREYVVFCGGEEEPGYGVKTSAGETVIYAAHFYKDTAVRIIQLLSINPQRSWEDLEPILVRDGYDVKFVTLDTANKEVSPGRRNLRENQPKLESSASVLLGAFKLDASIDSDGHLTVIVKSTDGSPAEEVDTEVGCADDELGYRFTTAKIESDYREQH